jgi:hypothetical protein
MTTQTVPLEALQKVQKHLRSRLTLPDSENCPGSAAPSFDEPDQPIPLPDSLAGLGDLFAIGSSVSEGALIPNNQGQWFLSVTDPAIALNRLPGLFLKSNCRLATYLYRMRDSGIGQTYALPEALGTTAYLEAAIPATRSLEHPPHPGGALPDLMEAITGDHSLMSYLFASVLRRELEAFGSIGAHQQWHQHRFISAAPPQASWQWRTENAPDLQPKIYQLLDGEIVVEFFSCRVYPSIAIFQHLDQYEPGSYVAQAIDRPIAFAEGRAA